MKIQLCKQELAFILNKILKTDLTEDNICIEEDAIILDAVPIKTIQTLPQTLNETINEEVDLLTMEKLQQYNENLTYKKSPGSYERSLGTYETIDPPEITEKELRKF